MKKRGTGKLELVNLKVTKKERLKLEENAERYTKGNLSEWLREAGTRYAPPSAIVRRRKQVTPSG